MTYDAKTIDSSEQEVGSLRTDSNESKFSFDSLESVRRKLLDLSGRNSLLNYKHPSTSCVRLIDELPDQIFTDLQDEKVFCFIPVPAPTERELTTAGYIVRDPQTNVVTKREYPTAIQWAKHKGLSVSFDLPEKITAEASLSRHQDSDLQTLLYAPELEARLRAIRGKADTALEESGANVLYLALGFLEWYESNDSDKPHYAPLFTIPVQLEKGKLDSKEGVFSYTIKQKDDGYLTNVTLRELLAQDFDLVLPDIDEETLPEAYFDKIERTLFAHQPRWKIKRQATLALLDFAKQAMYEDLNPAKWPAHKNITQHPLITQFFSASARTVDASSQSYASEHAIDTLEHIHQQFPLIYEADSSQHSAIIDAVRGVNLVIEGPPGTGKSQTITNLIAAAIGNGKRVLFVAEKMAALEVVKHRLDKAGLGDFCLELHSHKSNKLQVLTDLNNRLVKQGNYRAPREIETDIARYEDLKEKLSHYVAFINKPWKNTGLCLHQILTGAVRYREELKIPTDHLQIANLSGKDLTPVRFKELADNTAMLADIYSQVSQQAPAGNIANHYWFGVNKYELAAYQGQELTNHLRAWSHQLSELHEQWQQFKKSAGQTNSAQATIAEISTTSLLVANLPDLDGQEPLQLLPTIAENLTLFDEFTQEYRAIHRDYRLLGNVFKNELFTSGEAQADVAKAFALLAGLTLAEESDLPSLASSFQDIKQRLTALGTISATLTAIRAQSPAALQICFTTTPEGLSEFATLITIIGQLPSDLWRYRDDIYDELDLDQVISNLTTHLKRITPLHKQLIEHFSLHRLPDTQSLKNTKAILDNDGLFSFLSSEWRNAKKSIIGLAASVKPDKKELLALLPQLLEYRTELDAIEAINRNDGILGDAYKGVDTPIERIASLRQWYKTVRNEYGLGFGERVDIGSSILKLDRNIAMSLREPKILDIAANVSQLVRSVETYREQFPGMKARFSSQADLSAENSALKSLGSLLSTALTQLKPWITDVKKPVSMLEYDFNFLVTMSERTTAWNNSFFGKQILGKILSAEKDCDSEKAIATFERCGDIARQLQHHPDFIKNFALTNDTTAFQNLKSISRNLQQLLPKVDAAEGTFSGYGRVDIEEWTQSSKGIVTSIIARNQAAVDNPLWLVTWLEYIRIKVKLSQQGLGAIIENLENCKFPPQVLSTVLKLVVYDQLAQEAFKENSYLGLFSGLEQMAIRNKFQEYDKRLLQLQRELVAYKASLTNPASGNNSGKVSEYTETSLIKHEAGKKTRHVPVRNLLKRANKSIGILKPCFMMSPMSVAQYLQPGEFEFDLVVMDEASQIRPEDALGAIARGKSLIVVGDPKQLPPTSFFQRALNNEENGDDVVAAEQSESILETVIPMFRNRRLRWHYRSKHESLIAFSNRQFYDDNLVIFPSPFQRSSEFGVVFHRVAKGRFVTRRNTEEAREIVAKTADLLLKQPNDSIGIVAMSAEQKDEIEKQLEQLLKDNPHVANAYEENRQTSEPLFVKNLENVQGDERDIILISMTYGPEQIGGRTMQRFGPINSDVGGRRLNVLFTRSKKQMHIFSSMGSSDILVSNTSSRGMRALRAFLEYCETRHLHSTTHTGKAPDSDFEVSVIRALNDYGYECEPQLGTAGYFLDIAVRDPGNPGRFLLGIECDGASYHSAKSARDRDRLRQEILEGLGWKIKRIWSTDWFSNPQAQLAPILTELEALRTPASFNNEALEVNSEEPATESILIRDNEPQITSNTGTELATPQSGAITLKERLIKFEAEVIIPDLPTTSPDERLLRPAMIEALLDSRPGSKAEFSELIPHYLRRGTSALEGKYLDRVLEMIADDS